MDCIVTQGIGACSGVATIWPGGPTTRPHDMASKGHDTAGLRVAWQPGVSRDTMVCIVAEGGLYVAIWAAIRPSSAL